MQRNSGNKSANGGTPNIGTINASTIKAEGNREDHRTMCLKQTGLNSPRWKLPDFLHARKGFLNLFRRWSSQILDFIWSFAAWWSMNNAGNVGAKVYGNIYGEAGFVYTMYTAAPGHQRLPANPSVRNIGRKVRAAVDKLTRWVEQCPLFLTPLHLHPHTSPPPHPSPTSSYPPPTYLPPTIIHLIRPTVHKAPSPPTYLPLTSATHRLPIIHPYTPLQPSKV